MLAADSSVRRDKARIHKCPALLSVSGQDMSHVQVVQLHRRRRRHWRITVLDHTQDTAQRFTVP